MYYVYIYIYICICIYIYIYIYIYTYSPFVPPSRTRCAASHTLPVPRARADTLHASACTRTPQEFRRRRSHIVSCPPASRPLSDGKKGACLMLAALCACWHCCRQNQAAGPSLWSDLVAAGRKRGRAPGGHAHAGRLRRVARATRHSCTSCVSHDINLLICLCICHMSYVCVDTRCTCVITCYMRI